jgi:multisubunit Na+/H+ antiporter MnhE subunit
MMISVFLGRIILSLWMALMWMVLTPGTTIESFLVGWVISIGILLVLYSQGIGRHLRPTPVYTLLFLRYLLRLLFDIFISSLDVTRRVLHPNLPLKPGIIAVPVHDDNEAIAALSALSITLTPGELVVEFDGAETMYVHCLDVEQSAATIIERQAERASILRRVWGLD